MGFFSKLISKKRKPSKNDANKILTDKADIQAEPQTNSDFGPEKKLSETDFTHQLLETEEFENAITLLEKIDDEDCLKDIVFHHPNEAIKITALEKIDPRKNYSFFTNEWQYGELLDLKKRALELSGNSYDEEDIIYALDKNTDVKFKKMLLDRIEELENLINYKNNDSNPDMIQYVDQLIDKKIGILIPKIVKRTSLPENVIKQKLSDIILNNDIDLDENGISEEIVRSINDPKLLAQVALNAWPYDLQVMTSERIEDPDVLGKIVIGSTDSSDRVDRAKDIALSKLTNKDQNLIDRIISNTNKPRHKVAAANLLNDKDRALKIQTEIIENINDSTNCEEITPFIKNQDLIIRLLKAHGRHFSDFILDAVQNLTSEDHLLIAARDIEINRNYFDSFNSYFINIIEKINNRSYLEDIIQNALYDEAKLRAKHKLGLE